MRRRAAVAPGPEGSRGAELSSLARNAASDRDGARAFALRTTLRALLDAGADGEIDAAMRACRSFAAVRLIRRTAEREASEIALETHRTVRRMALFVVPIVATFDEEVPETGLDIVLRRRTPEVLRALDEARDRACGDRWVVVPQLFALDDLRSLPLSTVRDGARMLADAQIGATVQRWQLSPDRAARRSAAFARFVVGLRSAHAHEVRGWCLPSVDEAVRTALFDGLGTRVSVQSWLCGRFFDGLFEGMWRYQDVRLAQLCEHPCRREPCCCEVSARLAVEGGTEQHWLRVSLDCVGALDLPQARSLCGRPGDPASASIARVSRRLRAAGVRKVELVSRTDGRVGAQPPEGLRALRGVAIPI